ncbi:ndh1 [Mytilus edulis]|uniref:Ndh1 n=1 Tax=Mytilus edulis TaxID=6550 RepID=A0A8S3QIA2_MYTED|nr:ndh1 [Mytilus edulis]
MVVWSGIAPRQFVSDLDLKKNKQGQVSNGEIIPCGMVVWSGGIAPRQFVSDLDLKKNKQGQVSNGETIPCGMVVWSGGIAPRQFVRDLDLKKNKQGQVMTDKYLHVLGDDSKSVFAIGDCADVQDMPLPCTAQVAEKKADNLAKMLNHGKEFAEPFKFQSMGMLAYIGKYQALTDVKQIKMQGRKKH